MLTYQLICAYHPVIKTMKVALLELSQLSDALYQEDELLLKWENRTVKYEQLCETMGVDCAYRKTKFSPLYTNNGQYTVIITRQI